MSQDATIRIGNANVGIHHEPFIVAEMSGNHNQSLDRAIEIVEAAAKAGAHAVKLQTYTADTMTIPKADGEFCIQDKKSLWQGRTLYDLYQEAHTPWEWHKPIFDRCKALGVVCFSTPFDETAVDFLESLGAPAYKIASFENIDLPLIRKVASTGKPMIVSTGMASLAEIDEVVQTFRRAGGKDIILLKCTSNYPASPMDSNVKTIAHMRSLFHTQIGLSDHTMGIGVSCAAVAFGATFIEKHFTLDRSEGGVDSAFSLEPHELTNLVIESKRAWQSIGIEKYGVSEAEKPSLAFRRSLYVVEDMVAGQEFTAANVRRIRPGSGLAPKYYDIVLGKRCKTDIARGTPMSWDLLE